MNRLVALLRALLLMMATMIQPCISLGAYMEMIINNGIAPKVAEPCNFFDNIRINTCFAPSGARRFLRSSNNIVSANATHHQQQLQQQHQRQAYPLICKDLCAGFAPKTCRAKQCEGYRRDLQHDLVEQYDENHSRNLFLDMAICNTTIDTTNICLNMILWSLSANCRAFYNPKLRTATCRLFELC